MSEYRHLDPAVQFIAADTPHHTQGFIGGLYTRPFGPVKKGFTHEGHAHWIDHSTFVIAGSIRIDWRNKKTGQSGLVIVEGPWKLGQLPTQVQIKAEVEHTITAEEDGTIWMCVFAEAEGDKVALEKNMMTVPWTGETDV